MDGIIGGAGDIIKGAASIVTAPFAAVGKTVETVVSAPFKGAKTLLVGNGQNELTGMGGDANGSFNAALKQVEQG